MVQTFSQARIMLALQNEFVWEQYNCVSEKRGIDKGIIEALPKPEATFFPNPAKDVIHARINIGSASIANLSINDLNGRIVSVSTMAETINSFDFDISEWTGGIYIWKLETGIGEMLSGKIVVIR